MSGTLGVIAQDNNRYTAFWACVEMLNRPPNTRFDMVVSTDIPSARNTIVRRALENGSEWVMFVDDDHTFPQDMLTRLLAHDVPVVSALYVGRAGAHEPKAYARRNESKLYDTIDLLSLPGEGLLKVHAVGAGGLLVRTEVFDGISQDPDWFEHGRVVGEDWNAAEDIIFCEKARRAGFSVYVDLGVRLGHMTPSAVWPQFIDNQWCLGFSVADGTQLYVPIEPTQQEAADSYEEVAN